MVNKKKDEKPKTLKAGGTKHTVKKNKRGDVIVDHAGDQGKWDKINLTKKGGSKTIKQGVKAVKTWHKNNPHKGKEK
jgi:NAD/NADP transhydrogenase alpha subunit